MEILVAIVVMALMVLWLCAVAIVVASFLGPSNRGGS